MMLFVATLVNKPSHGGSIDRASVAGKLHLPLL